MRRAGRQAAGYLIIGSAAIDGTAAGPGPSSIAAARETGRLLLRGSADAQAARWASNSLQTWQLGQQMPHAAATYATASNAGHAQSKDKSMGSDQPLAQLQQSSSAAAATAKPSSQPAPAPTEAQLLTSMVLKAAGSILACDVILGKLLSKEVSAEARAQVLPVFLLVTSNRAPLLGQHASQEELAWHSGLVHRAHDALLGVEQRLITPQAAADALYALGKLHQGGTLAPSPALVDTLVTRVARHATEVTSVTDAGYNVAHARRSGVSIHDLAQALVGVVNLGHSSSSQHWLTLAAFTARELPRAAAAAALAHKAAADRHAAAAAAAAPAAGAGAGAQEQQQEPNCALYMPVSSIAVAAAQAHARDPLLLKPLVAMAAWLAQLPGSRDGTAPHSAAFASKTALAFLHLGVRDAPLFTALAQCAHPGVSHLSVKHVAMLTEAFSGVQRQFQQLHQHQQHFQRQQGDWQPAAGQAAAAATVGEAPGPAAAAPAASPEQLQQLLKATGRLLQAAQRVLGTHLSACSDEELVRALRALCSSKAAGAGADDADVGLGPLPQYAAAEDLLSSSSSGGLSTDLMDGVLQQLQQRLPRMQPHQVAAAVAALAPSPAGASGSGRRQQRRSVQLPQPLLWAVEAHAQARNSQYTGDDATRLFIALARLGEVGPDVGDALIGQVVAQAHALEPHLAVEMVKSLALGRWHRGEKGGLLEALWHRVLMGRQQQLEAAAELQARQQQGEQQQQGDSSRASGSMCPGNSSSSGTMDSARPSATVNMSSSTTASYSPAALGGAQEGAHSSSGIGGSFASSSSSESSSSSSTAEASSAAAVDVERAAAGLDPRTSLMIRNVPNTMPRHVFQKILDVTSAGRYDFLHLPFSRSNQGGGKGYALVNFATPQDVARCAERLHGHKLRYGGITKVAAVEYARKQGFEALLRANQLAQPKNPSSAFVPLILPIKPLPAEQQRQGQQQDHHHQRGCQQQEHQQQEQRGAGPAGARPLPIPTLAPDPQQQYAPSPHARPFTPAQVVALAYWFDQAGYRSPDFAAHAAEQAAAAATSKGGEHVSSSRGFLVCRQALQAISVIVSQGVQDWSALGALAQAAARPLLAAAGASIGGAAAPAAATSGSLSSSTGAAAGGGASSSRSAAAAVPPMRLLSEVLLSLARRHEPGSEAVQQLQPLLSVAAQLLHTQPQAFHPQDMSRAVWALAKLGHTPGSMYDSVSDRLLQLARPRKAARHWESRASGSRGSSSGSKSSVAGSSTGAVRPGDGSGTEDGSAPSAAGGSSNSAETFAHGHISGSSSSTGEPAAAAAAAAGTAPTTRTVDDAPDTDAPHVSCDAPRTAARTGDAPCALLPSCSSGVDSCSSSATSSSGSRGGSRGVPPRTGKQYGHLPLSPDETAELVWAFGCGSSCLMWKREEVAELLAQQVARQLHMFNASSAVKALWGLASLAHARLSWSSNSHAAATACLNATAAAGSSGSSQSGEAALHLHAHAHACACVCNCGSCRQAAADSQLAARLLNHLRSCYDLTVDDVLLLGEALELHNAALPECTGSSGDGPGGSSSSCITPRLHLPEFLLGLLQQAAQATGLQTPTSPPSGSRRRAGLWRQLAAAPAASIAAGDGPVGAAGSGLSDGGLLVGSDPQQQQRRGMAAASAAAATASPVHAPAAVSGSSSGSEAVAAPESRGGHSSACSCTTTGSSSSSSHACVSHYQPAPRLEACSSSSSSSASSNCHACSGSSGDGGPQLQHALDQLVATVHQRASSGSVSAATDLVIRGHGGGAVAAAAAAPPVAVAAGSSGQSASHDRLLHVMQVVADAVQRTQQAEAGLR